MPSDELIDISPMVSARFAVFPGDEPFSYKRAMDFVEGDNLTLSSIATTVHVGAHADASLHYNKNGTDIASRDLSHYWGHCQVIDVSALASMEITEESLVGKTISAPRVLFKTNSFKDPNVWQDEFCYFSPKVITLLAKQGVKTIGIDTPSVDERFSKNLPSHQALFDSEMAVLECLILSHVLEGNYFLSALPLRLENLDASPVRAILAKYPQ